MEAVPISVIGGGTGSFTVLSGLRSREHFDIRSIVTTTDSGGDSGRLRDEFGILPPGDLRRCMVALSEEGPLLRSLFSYRFSEPPLEGRQFGNLLFLALTRMLGSEPESVEAIGRLLNVRGQVIPVTWDKVHLHAELSDGNVVVGEANIDMPQHDASIPIRRVYLEPQATANPAAIRALEESRCIVVAPGDLYTSTIPNFLVHGIAALIKASRAPFVYVMNLMTKHGETDGFTAADHVATVAKYVGRVPDVVLVHDGPIPENLLSKYAAEGSYPVSCDAAELARAGVSRTWRADVMSRSSLVRHDPERVALTLEQVISQGLG